MRTRLALALALAATGTATAAATATGTAAAQDGPGPAAHTRPGAAAADGAWHTVYRHDFGTLRDISAFTSTATLNSTLRPTDTNQSLLQKPTLASNVAVTGDAGASDGKALAVRTQRASYATRSGPAYGWTNGRLMLRGQDQAPPVRIRTRLRFTPSIGTKSAIMWWPSHGGWRWEVDFAETFGGKTLTSYWGGRQHVSQRWHGDGPDRDTKANEQIAKNVDMDGTRYHVYDLFITGARMWVEIDGTEVFSTTDRQFLPTGAGFFSIGKASEGVRNSPTRTADAVFVDWLEISKPGGTTDTTAPAAPGGLRASGAAAGVSLGWTAGAESDIAGYNVYRAATPGGTYSRLNDSGPVAAVRYVDGTAASGGTYSYAVTAVDNAGNESGRAPAATATRPLAIAEQGAATYTQTWITDTSGGFSGGSAAYSRERGSTAVYRFSGSAVTWITSRGPRSGTATVWYDGVRQTSVNLYSARKRSQVVGWTSPTAAGEHTLLVHVDQDRWVGVDAFRTAG